MKPLVLVALALTLALGAAGCGHRQVRDTEREMGMEPEERPGDIYVKLAAEYLRLGQPDQALRRAEQAVREDGSNPRAHYILAYVFQRLGQTEQADASYRKAIELAPNNSDILNAYGGFQCSRRNYAEADRQFAQALQSPLYATPWVAMTNAGACAAAAGNVGRAETEYRRALSANPRFGPALFKMAELEHGRGNDKEAKSYMDRYFQTNGASPSALALATRVERGLGDRKAAATYEQMLKKSFPTARETREL